MKHSCSSSCSAILSQSTYDNLILSLINIFGKNFNDVYHCIYPSVTRCISCSPSPASFSTNFHIEFYSRLYTFFLIIIMIALYNCGRGRVLDLTQLGIERVSVGCAKFKELLLSAFWI